LPDKTELLACPWCAEVPSRILGMDDRFAHSWDSNCPLAGQQFSRSAWNTRPTPPPPVGERAELIERLRAAMDRKGFTTRDVASETGLSFSTVARFLREGRAAVRTKAALRDWTAKSSPSAREHFAIVLPSGWYAEIRRVTEASERHFSGPLEYEVWLSDEGVAAFCSAALPSFAEAVGNIMGFVWRTYGDDRIFDVVELPEVGHQ
jgi:transcriptional regulator with XRE-family HTH domain